MTELRIEYDRRAGAVWLAVSGQPVASTVCLGNGVSIDRDANNVPVAVEIANVTSVVIREDVTE